MPRLTCTFFYILYDASLPAAGVKLVTALVSVATSVNTELDNTQVIYPHSTSRECKSESHIPVSPV